MIIKKISKKIKSLIRKIFLLIYGKITISKDKNYLTNILEITNFQNDIFRKQKYYLYSTSDCRIYTDLNENVAVIKDNIILEGHSYQQTKGCLEGPYSNSVFKNGTPYLKKKIKGTIFNLLQGASGENYFHFLCDILPKIWLLNTKVNINEIDFFLVNKRIKWQTNILNSLGINNNKIISAKNNRHIHAEKVLSVTHPWYFSGYIQEQVSNLPSWIIYELRNNFLKKTSPKKNLKIFLDRSGSKFNHLKLINNQDVINFLKTKGYIILKPETLSLKDQVEIFNNANIIIGAHGAALTNIIFCEQKTNIIEIIPSSHPSKKCERISKVLNLNYFRLVTEDTKNDTNFPFYINIDLNILKNVIKSFE